SSAQRPARPGPVALSPLPAGDMWARKPKRERRLEEGRGPAPAREPRRPEMEGGVWFTISLGRKQRADPKWLLPMICKAGGVTKREVGSVRIYDTETRFQIAAQNAAEFAEQIKRPGGMERGLVIAPAVRVT